MTTKVEHPGEVLRELLGTEPWRPDYSVHPGEVLRELLGDLGLRQTDLVRATGFSAKHINQVIQGHARIGPEFALSLEESLEGPSAEFWLTMQTNHDLHELRARTTKG
jgi:addiction module HigA family antidote